jgi:hypothetical protein
VTREEKIAAIVEAVNAATDVPFIGEVTEGQAITYVANKTLVHLPDWALDLFFSLTDGLDDREVLLLTEVLSGYVNAAIDVPWVPESVEKVAIEQAIAFILAKAKEGVSVIQE